MHVCRLLANGYNVSTTAPNKGYATLVKTAITSTTDPMAGKSCQTQSSSQNGAKVVLQLGLMTLMRTVSVMLHLVLCAAKKALDQGAFMFCV